jgi:hypothetical protein
MGYGAFMSLHNNRKETISVFVVDVNCMFDDGEQGSNLSLFNNAQVPSGTSLPASGRQYIEVKASGGCFFQDSNFTLKIEGSSGAIIGNAVFTESDNNYSSSSTNTDLIDILLNNSGDQATITVTVE